MTYIPRSKRTQEQKAEAAEYVKAKTEGLKASVTAKIDALSEALQGGRSEEFLKFLAFSANFHHYSFSNQLLIMMQAPDAERVAGYQAWKAVGRNVKKGAKSVSILRPLLVPDREQPKGADGKHPQKMVGYKYVSVFADYDTEGQDMPDFMTVKGQEETARAAFAAMLDSARKCGITVQEEKCGSAHGYTDGQKIVIDPEKCRAEPAHALRVLAHEWAHWELHYTHEGMPAADRPTRKVRELEADAVAFVLCSFYGVDTSANSADYIANWGGNPDALKASMNRIQRTVKAILSACQHDAATDADADAETIPNAAD